MKIKTDEYNDTFIYAITVLVFGLLDIFLFVDAMCHYKEKMYDYFSKTIDMQILWLGLLAFGFLCATAALLWGIRHLKNSNLHSKALSFVTDSLIVYFFEIISIGADMFMGMAMNSFPFNVM